MNFDFFSIKVNAESQSSDEVILGFFFGKVEGRLEFQFISFARRFKDFAKINLSLDLSEFKNVLNQTYRKLISRSGDILSRTNDFLSYLTAYINKNGGRHAFSTKISSIIENKDTEALKALLRDLFDEWTSDVKISFEWNCFTFNEMSLKESSKTEHSLDILNAIENTKERKDLLDIADFYPIVDPMEGNQVAGLKVGDSIFLTIIMINDEDEKQRLMNDYPEKFDKNGTNIKPFEGYITAMEYVFSNKGTILLKVLIDNWFEAKSFIMSTIRIMQKNKRKNLLKQDLSFQERSTDEVGDNIKKKDNIKNVSEKEKLIDQIIIASLTALIIIVILIIIFLFI